MMTDLRDEPFFVRARQEGRVVVEEPPKLDLDSYVSNYKGRTRYDRLYLIGCSSTYLCFDALKAAILEAKNGNDTSRYERAVTTLAEIFSTDPDAILDKEWVMKKKASVHAETRRMESELKGYKNNLIKESIRMGYQDLGMQYQNLGDLTNSTKSFSKMYDYMTTNSHLVTMSMLLIKVALDQQNWYAVTMNAQRIWANGQTKYEDAKKQSAKLTSALGIADLASRNYRNAADWFIETDPRMAQAKLDDPSDEEAYNEVLTPNDLAIYGGLCALASYSRSELQSKVLDHKSFRDYLELEPHIRRAITFFISSKYSACLSILENWRSDYLLDIYLQPCFMDMFERIRRKAIQQYFIPFSCVSLKALAAAFNTSEDTMEVELVLMITRADLDARIDIVNRLLLAREVNERLDVHTQALREAKQYQRTLRLRMLRMAIVYSGLEVKANKEKATLSSGKAVMRETLLDSTAAGDLIDGTVG